MDVISSNGVAIMTKLSVSEEKDKKKIEIIKPQNLIMSILTMYK